MTANPASLAGKLVAAEPDPPERSATELLGRRFDSGLAWVHFPTGSGGLDLAPADQPTVDRIFDEAGWPAPRDDIAHLMIAPTIAAHGTSRQRGHWLRPLYTGEEIWCQLFSEPGAGSDLAGLAMRAERDGDGWRLRGDKVWSTFAHLARWAMVLVRTDPDVAKHRGLTMMVVEMTSAGVTVAPLRQLTGQAEFNQVHFEEVFVPSAHTLGEPEQGWTVTLTTLMNERASVGDGLDVMGGDFGAALRRRWRELSPQDPGRQLRRDGTLRELARREVMSMMADRTDALATAETPGPDGSLTKLLLGESNQAAASLLTTLHGPEGALYPSGYRDRGDVDIDSFTSGTARAPDQERFLRTVANTIEGGTTEVMRNIVGERVLGLPGEPRPDRGLSWRDTPR